MPYGRVSRVGQEIRTKAFERILECVPAIRLIQMPSVAARMWFGARPWVDPAHGIGIHPNRPVGSQFCPPSVVSIRPTP